MIKVLIVEKKSPPKKRFEWETILKILGLLGTLFTIIFGVLQYKKTESWKREEFIITQFNQFKQNTYVVAARHLLDYQEGSIKLGTDTAFTYKNATLYFALSDKGSYDPIEYAIREIFDHYFDELSSFNRYINAELVEFKEIKPYFEYHINIIGDTTNKRKDNAIRRQLWHYINHWHFKDVAELCRRYGYEIKE